MKKSIRYKTKLKYVEYVELCVLSSQQTTEIFRQLGSLIFKVIKTNFFSDFNANETNKISLCQENVHWDFLKKSFHYSFLGEGRGAGRCVS